MGALQIKNFKAPDESRDIPGGKIHTVKSPSGAFSIGVMQPGWRWSTDIKPVVGTEWCEFEHLEYVVSGRLAIRTKDGEETTAGPSDVYYIPPGHDGWVVGDEPLVTLSWGPEAEFGKEKTNRP
jgi:hypothetical protein